ncbi:MAG: integrase arm-type DNA-binding domain-containing protein, partial [Myxococcales bacterium]|nr:integrase arm-type DNA-binding domain-containing protein [Myxococcales bacterium]
MSRAITKSTLRALKPRRESYEVTCSRLPGFVVRVLPSGKKVFLVRLASGGRGRRVRIGQWEAELSLAAAREQALAILAGVVAPSPARARGARATPLAARRSFARDDAAAAVDLERTEPTRSRPTVRELSARFLREYVDVYLRAGTGRGYRACLENHILPALGDRPFDTVTRRHVRALHASLRDRRALADSVLAVIGSLYTRIIDDWELSDMRNPTSRVRRFGSRRVERFLSQSERRRLTAVLAEGLRIPKGKKGNLARFSVWAIRLLMLTGLRRDEILSLGWSMVNWEHSVLYLPETKTGQRTVVVSGEVMELLKTIHEATRSPTSGLVLRGRNGCKLQGLNSTWERVR